METGRVGRTDEDDGLARTLAAAVAAAGGLESTAAGSAAAAWCMEEGLPALEGAPAAADEAARGRIAADGAAALRLLAGVPAPPGAEGGLGLVRPLFALALADLLRCCSPTRVGADVAHRRPPTDARGAAPEPTPTPADAVFGAVCAYVRAAASDEALAFAADWAGGVWEDLARSAEVPGTSGSREGPRLAARTAIQVAAIVISRTLVAAGGPSIDRRAYNRAAEAARDLLLRLAATAPGGTSPPPPGFVADAITAAEGRLAAWGFAAADGQRIGTLVRICRDFGRSLPARGHPGRRFLA